MNQLFSIQNEIKCPKSRKNAFGNYMYRNCDDIFDAVKPVAQKHGCVISVTDEVVMIGDRFYVKATATIINDQGVSVSCTGWAREPLTKKGMDEAQITGTASSYARKIALGGLLLLDDSQDMDGQPQEEKKAHEPKRGVITVDQAITIRDFLKQSKTITEESLCKTVKIAKLEDLQASRYDGAIKYLNETIGAESK